MTHPDVSEQHRRAVRGVLIWAPLSTLIILLYVAPVFFAAAKSRVTARSLPIIVIPTALAGLLLYAVLRACVQSIGLVRRPLGYSERHWRVVNKELRFSIRAELIGSSLAVPLTAYAVWGGGLLAELFVGWAAVVDAVFLFLIMTCVGGVDAVLRHATVVPYFQKKVGEIDTFANGMHVARHLSELDELANSLGMAPLSSFGWNDDMAGDPLVWHEASAGRKTVNALLAQLQGEELAREGLSGTIEDLKRIAHALDRADERDIQFCLLLRHGGTTSEMEWDVRRGTCF